MEVYWYCIRYFLCLNSKFLVFLMWFVPSLDEIQQRRADVKALKPYALQVRETSDGKTLVRIMSKTLPYISTN